MQVTTLAATVGIVCGLVYVAGLQDVRVKWAEAGGRGRIGKRRGPADGCGAALGAILPGT